jgi:hypothetical protein
MDGELLALTSTGHAEALTRRNEIAQLALAERNASARALGGREFASVAEYAADVATRTVCLTLLAGSGSRWTKSLAEARALPEGERPSWFDPGYDPELPRGLYPVHDFLGVAGPRRDGRIAIAAYSLAAVRGLGRHLVVVRGHEGAIDAEVLSPLGIMGGDRSFFTQAAPFGRPLGHGDAAWQCRGLYAGARYVVTNFGGDANSRRTILSSLLALDALKEMGAAVDLLIPAARIASAAYPIGLDAAGLPRSFGHAKLQGAAAPGLMADGSGYTNVGVRVYSAKALGEMVGAFRSRWWVDGTGYAIPGNDPEGHEFALDNVDAQLAREGRARILAASLPEELTPAKSLADVPAFERAVEKVVALDGRPGS